MEHVKNHHVVAITLLVTVVAITITMATAQTEPASQSQYDLNITTEQPVIVNETAAELRANVTKLDTDFDAALVYWNYSQQGQGVGLKGPANIVLDKNFDGSKTVESLQTGLTRDTAYDVEAYVDTVIWSESRLMDNFVEKGLDQEREGADALPVNSSSDMDAVASSSTAMNAVSSSSTAMYAVSNSSTALSSISSNAVSYIKNNWNQQSLSDGEKPPIATVYYVELEGAGGGGGDAEAGVDGGDGGESSFGGAVAKGGEGGSSGGSDGSPGGTSAPPSPSQVVVATTGGGASGGSGHDNGGKGGDGGYIAALISNSDESSLSASVGTGGDPGFNGGEGGDGSLTVWFPPSAN